MLATCYWSFSLSTPASSSFSISSIILNLHAIILFSSTSHFITKFSSILHFITLPSTRFTFISYFITLPSTRFPSISRIITRFSSIFHFITLSLTTFTSISYFKFSISHSITRSSQSVTMLSSISHLIIRFSFIAHLIPGIFSTFHFINRFSSSERHTIFNIFRQTHKLPHLQADIQSYITPGSHTSIISRKSINISEGHTGIQLQKGIQATTSFRGDTSIHNSREMYIINVYGDIQAPMTPERHMATLDSWKTYGYL